MTTANFSKLQFSLGNFSSVEIPNEDFLIGLQVSGKIGNETKPDPLNVYGIYQMRMTKRGKVPIKMKFYRPTNPRTAAQQANRDKFASAMASWKNMT